MRYSRGRKTLAELQRSEWTGDVGLPWAPRVAAKGTSTHRDGLMLPEGHITAAVNAAELTEMP
jgi:hypothetical protein